MAPMKFDIRRPNPETHVADLMGDRVQITQDEPGEIRVGKGEEDPRRWRDFQAESGRDLAAPNPRFRK